MFLLAKTVKGKGEFPSILEGKSIFLNRKEASGEITIFRSYLDPNW